MSAPSPVFLKDLRSSNHEDDDLPSITHVCRTFGPGEDMPLDTSLVVGPPARLACYGAAW
jgi:hypothetical protein